MINITVRSEKEDKRIPIAVASDVMSDIQLLLSHIGESLISDELGSYGRPSEALTGRFTLFIDPESGGISFKASAGKGKSTLMDKAVALLSATLEKMGSGSGTYWMEDAFRDPRYRCLVLGDLIRLSNHMDTERGYSLMLNDNGKESKFIPMDIEKAQAFLNGNGKMAVGTVHGVLHSARSKRNIPMYSFAAGAGRAKITFLSKDAENDASEHANGAVVVTGTLRYSDDRELLDVSGADNIIPFTKRSFSHMISADRDIPLAAPVESKISYDIGTMTWKLTYPDLGITASNTDWDTAVAEFHDYFVFLCDNYSEKDDNELSEEEKEVKDTLRTLTGAE
ncbi:MAG: hypothetical protein FWH44_01980 [Methanomassiliicoccaceae archaeon]|nr:hypothetical protein [Methanomassiliicoccaceae archaeon]